MAVHCILGVCTLVPLSSSGPSHTGSSSKCKAKVDGKFTSRRNNGQRMRRSNKLRMITSESGMAYLHGVSELFVRQLLYINLIGED